MSKKYVFLVLSILVVLTSCLTPADNIAGKYSNGSWTASGAGFTTLSGVNNAEVKITPNGHDKVDIVFTSPGNSVLNIDDVRITEVSNSIVFQSNSSYSINGSYAGGVLSFNYTHYLVEVSLVVSGFSK